MILTARLLPFISFDFISYAAGLSTIKMRSFLFATGIGMIPATIVYTVFGYEMEKLNMYDLSFKVSYGLRLYQYFTAGIGIKYIHRDLSDITEDAFDMDFTIFCTTPMLSPYIIVIDKYPDRVIIDMYYYTNKNGNKKLKCNTKNR